jgi:hypothetical protein
MLHEADCKAIWDTYESTHSYDVYHYDLDSFGLEHYALIPCDGVHAAHDD